MLLLVNFLIDFISCVFLNTPFATATNLPIISIKPFHNSAS